MCHVLWKKEVSECAYSSTPISPKTASDGYIFISFLTNIKLF